MSTVVNTMTYDNYGNILTKNGKVYTYDSTWKDQLTSYDGQSITYDAQGNPTTYLGKTLTWEKGHQLKSIGNTVYTYNFNGIRTSKTVNGVRHDYVLNGTRILRETWAGNVLIPLYDNENNVCGIKFNNISYFFCKNMQGDVISITDIYGDTVVRYSYDAWGSCKKTFDSTLTLIGDINPFRYRNYYYDRESDLYYIQSRYYDPDIGRFISPDKQLGTNNDIATYNLYAYCGNSPVGRYDAGGHNWFSSTMKKLGEVFAEPAMTALNAAVNWASVNIPEKYKDIIRSALKQGNQYLQNKGIDTAEIGAYLLDMHREGDVYYADFNCWQAEWGYCNLYDFIFDIGTSMKPNKIEFIYNRKKHVFWFWKGDYINLGLGAELGIYYNGPDYWKVDKSLAMKMWMAVYCKGDCIINRSDYTWWITGFNPNSKYKYQKINVDQLSARFWVKLKNDSMYKQFKTTHSCDNSKGLRYQCYSYNNSLHITF